MREHKRAHQSELLVIVRDARGVQEEKPLRVRAKFDDEEKMTVRFALIFLFLRVFLFCIFFFVFARGSLVLMLTRKRTRVSDQHFFPPLSLSVDVCVQSNAKTESGETIDAPEMEPDVGFPANAVGDEEVVATRRRDVEVDRADGVGGGGRRRSGFRGVDDER